MVKKDPYDEALRRAEIILPLLDEALSSKERVQKQKEIARETAISYRTLSRYKSMYQEGGVRTLVPKTHLNKGQQVIDEALFEKAVALRLEVPTRSVEDLIMILEKEGEVESGIIKRSTLQRYLQKAGYSRREMNTRVFNSDISALRFQKKHRMDLVQADIKYGPYIYIKGRKIQTYYIGWIDDYSRFALSEKLYIRQGEEEVMSSFREMIETYGVPKKILTDNGSQYIAKCLRDTCIELGIVLHRHAPRACNVKGKIERFNRDISQFNDEANSMKIKSLEEVNAYFKTWLEVKHQTSSHSSLKGKTPEDVFFADTEAPLQMKSPEEIERAFLRRVKRKVSHDCCVSLFGKKYEVMNPDLRGKEVTILYSPLNYDELKIEAIGFTPSSAKPLIIGEHVDYEKKAKDREAKKNVLHPEYIEGNSSRLLEVMRKEYEEKNPQSTRFSIQETGEEKKEKTFVTSYSAINKEENNENTK